MEGYSQTSAQESTALGSAAQKPLHDAVWNFECVCFQVENKLFTVIKSGLLVPGSVFADMFQIPSDPQSMEGKDANNPIILHATRASDFSAFLSILYPWVNPKCDIYGLDEEALLGVLGLANRWNFIEIRQRATEAISSSIIGDKDASSKIRLGKAYFVEEWVLRGFNEIIKKKGFGFGDLEKEPYNFDQALVKKILYLQAEQASCPCGGKYSGRKINNKATHAIEQLLHDEVADAMYVPGSLI